MERIKRPNSAWPIIFGLRLRNGSILWIGHAFQLGTVPTAHCGQGYRLAAIFCSADVASKLLPIYFLNCSAFRQDLNSAVPHPCGSVQGQVHIFLWPGCPWWQPFQMSCPFPSVRQNFPVQFPAGSQLSASNTWVSLLHRQSVFPAPI